MPEPRILIFECGSQYTLKIEQSLRELGYRSVIKMPHEALAWVRAHGTDLIILSGGEASVHDADAPQIPRELLDLRNPSEQERMPILFICFGMQWLAYVFGGKVEAGIGEFGPTRIACCDNPLFRDMPKDQTVWMSHQERVLRLPESFIELAYSEHGQLAAMRHRQFPWWGVQFHPEVADTPFGKPMLKNVLDEVGCVPDWQPRSEVERIQENILSSMGNGRLLFGFSGGVDSTTLAAIAARSPKTRKQLLAVTIDGGQLREGELDEIRLHARLARVRHSVIDAKALFNVAMMGIVDAEEKRAAFKVVYAHLLMQAARESRAKIILQGTLAPDKIESGATGGALIKSHHNVGLDLGILKQLHPIDHLFKNEIRVLAEEIGLPPRVHNRHPFPGPGLFIRTLGIPATQDNVAVTRWCDVKVTEIYKSHGIFEKLSQPVTAFQDGLPTVGVKGDGRKYLGSSIIRAVLTIDFMTATGVYFPEEVVKEIKKVLPQHPRIVRVWIDVTDKPPGTTELE